MIARVREEARADGRHETAALLLGCAS